MVRCGKITAALLTGALLSVGLAVGAPMPAQAATLTWTVNDLGDAEDATPGNGICATAGGVCTLRAAITETILHPSDANRIHFSVAGTIQVGGAEPGYPAITANGTVIDGTTAPGWAANAPTITIRGTGRDAGYTGLPLSAADITVKGLRLGNWARAIEIQGPRAVIQGNQIGSAGGAYDPSLQVGRGIDALQEDALIGGPGAGQGNLIAGFWAKGINSGSGSTGLVIEGNRVGTNAAGTASAKHPDGTILVEFEGESSPNIAMDLSGAPDAMVRNNLISGNAGYGVAVEDGSATLHGNRIGTTADGSAALPNVGIGVAGQGTTTLQIGGTGVGQGNVISATTSVSTVGYQYGAGIWINDRAAATVQGNRIGTNAAGTAVLSNASVGVQVVANGSSATIGGSAAGAGNQIAGTSSVGIISGGVTGAQQNATTIQGNLIGTDATGAAKLGTLQIGIASGCGTKTQLGGTAAGAGNTISAVTTGLAICDAGRGSRVEGNKVGTNAAGTAVLPLASGVVVDAPGTGTGAATVGPTRLVLGGTAAGAGNQIAGAANDGINAKAPVDILGNTIGTNPAGTAALAGNGFAGVRVSRGGVVIGGGASGAGNLISGWNGYGILVSDATAAGTVIKGNRIGTDAAGTGSIPNRIGIGVQSANNTVIGGVGAGEFNTIANSTFDGIVDFPPVSGVSIRGNRIHSNGEQAIENSVNYWDGGIGANNNQLPPTMTATIGTTTTINGTLRSDKAGTVVVDIYASDTCTPDGSGEGKQFMGAISFSHPGGGAAQAFSGTLPKPATGLSIVTGVANVPGNGSSQFSECTPFSDLAVDAVANVTRAPIGDEVGALVTVTNRGPAPAVGVVAKLETGTGPVMAADTYVADIPSKGTIDTAAGTWNIGSLASGASATVCLRPTIVRATYDAGGFDVATFTNGGADTSAYAPDPYTGNDNNSAIVFVGERTASATPNVCPLPTLSVGDAQITRPTSGTSLLAFPVTLSTAQSRAVTVQYATQNGTAAGVIDFTPTTGTLTIPAGQTSGTISVPIVGNQSDEPDKAFTVVLSAPAKATIADGSATGTIKANGALAGCPQTPSSNQAFVCHLYFDALNRQAETGGFNYWVNRLNKGDPRSNMAKTYMAQAESRRVLVDRIYVFYLGRRGTAAELKSWADKLAAKTTTPEKIRISLLASAEYYARAGSTGEGWVVRVYKDVFRRDPDPGGKQYWLNKLTSGQSRTQVATGMLTTSEGRRRVIDDIFLRFLRRYPPQSESTPWVTQLNAGKTEIDVMVAVIASTEYFTRP